MVFCVEFLMVLVIVMILYGLLLILMNMVVLFSDLVWCWVVCMLGWYDEDLIYDGLFICIVCLDMVLLMLWLGMV